MAKLPLRGIKESKHKQLEKLLQEFKDRGGKIDKVKHLGNNLSQDSGKKARPRGKKSFPRKSYW